MTVELAEILDCVNATLAECDAYFDNRSDADCDQDGFVPNREMVILSDIRSAITLGGQEMVLFECEEYLEEAGPDAALLLVAVKKTLFLIDLYCRLGQRSDT